MIIKLKDNVIYETFNNKHGLQDRILTMILNCKTDKIIYKGNPNDIDYKMMKKVMMKKYTEKIDPEIIKSQYKEVVESCDSDFCIIYKEK